MINNVKRKIQEGFTLVEILIVVVIVGILAAIAIPTYFNYVEKAYASDAQTQIKTILEECKIWKTTNSEFPTKPQEMIDAGYGNISSSTLKKWDFDIKLEEGDVGTDIIGNIIATSLDEMPGGEGERVCYNAELGKFTGYGTNDECVE